jgi:hypothetical protein
MRNENGSQTSIAPLHPNDSHRGGKPKREIYGWKAAADRGEFMWLDKRLINIDHAYQRERVSHARVLEIARSWSWQALGVILLFKRVSDGRYYAYDGQHRVLASMKRDDVQELPCFVFPGDTVAEEADAYVAANTVRGPMQAIEKFKARIIALDPTALAIQAALEEWGYRVSTCSTPGNIACIGSLESVYVKDVAMFRRTLQTVVKLCNGDCFRDKIFNALAYVDEHMRRNNCGDISRRDVQEKLELIGLDALCEAGRKYSNLAGGKGGCKVWAAGIVFEINKGRRTNKLPPVFGE